MEKIEKEKIQRFFYERNPKLKEKGISFKNYCACIDILEAILGEIVEADAATNNNSKKADVINFEKARAGFNVDKDGK